MIYLTVAVIWLLAGVMVALVFGACCLREEE